MNDKLYIVYGLGESTGCRLFTKLLVFMGCYGRFDHDQDFDDFVENETKMVNQLRSIRHINKPPVIRFSYPHGDKIINLRKMYSQIKSAGYNNIYILFTTRSFPATIISTYENHCVENNVWVKHKYLKNPHLRAKFANIDCFSQIKRIFNKIDKNVINNFVVINLYDFIMYKEVHLKYIAKELKLQYPKDLDLSFIRKDVNDIRLTAYENRYL